MVSAPVIESQYGLTGHPQRPFSGRSAGLLQCHRCVSPKPGSGRSQTALQRARTRPCWWCVGSWTMDLRTLQTRWWRSRSWSLPRWCSPVGFSGAALKRIGQAFSGVGGSSCIARAARPANWGGGWYRAICTPFACARTRTIIRSALGPMPAILQLADLPDAQAAGVQGLQQYSVARVKASIERTSNLLAHEQLGLFRGTLTVGRRRWRDSLGRPSSVSS